MKYSLRERLSSREYLEKADEIMIEYRDRAAIVDFAKKYPKAQCVLEILPGQEWTVNEIKRDYTLSNNKLTICLPDLRDPRVAELKAAGIPFFYGYYLTSFWELEAVIACGVSQVRIDAPLFFQTDKLKRFDIPKRVSANIAHENYIPHINGKVGSWIRPEDIEDYEGIFDTIEFFAVNGRQEEALYRIYAEQKSWPGKVSAIITNIETEANNAMIPKTFVETRKNCGQRCTAGGACQVCYHILDLANPQMITDYMKEVEK